jgi:hypothetical protein
VTDVSEVLTASIIRVMMASDDGGSNISETSVNFYETTWCNIPEDSKLHTLCHGNLKSQLVSAV